MSNRKKDVLILLFFCALIFLPGLGLRDPWPADEPRFALAAKQMVETGQWFFPTLGGEYYPDKPPVFMWMIAACYALTGNLNVVFLLPSTLSDVAVVLLVYDLGDRLWSRRGGFQGHHSMFVNLLIIALFLSTVLWPVLNPIRSPRYMMRDVRSIIGPGAQLGLVSWKEQLLLHAVPSQKTFGRKTDHELQLQAAVAWLQVDTAERWLLIDGSKDLGPFDSQDVKYRKHLHGRDWLLFRGFDMKRVPDDDSAISSPGPGESETVR